METEPFFAVCDEPDNYGSQIVAKFNNKNSYQNQQFDT